MNCQTPFPLPNDWEVTSLLLPAPPAFTLPPNKTAVPGAETRASRSEVIGPKLPCGSQALGRGYPRQTAGKKEGAGVGKCTHAAWVQKPGLCQQELSRTSESVTGSKYGQVVLQLCVAHVICGDKRMCARGWQGPRRLAFQVILPSGSGSPPSTSHPPVLQPLGTKSPWPVDPDLGLCRLFAFFHPAKPAHRLRGNQGTSP